MTPEERLRKVERAMDGGTFSLLSPAAREAVAIQATLAVGELLLILEQRSRPVQKKEEVYVGDLSVPVATPEAIEKALAKSTPKGGKA